MNNVLGYKKNLFILPFDHRSSFVKLFGFIHPDLSSKEKETIIEAKEIIYEAFQKAVERKIPKEQAAILIDEEYGNKIIRDAKNNGYNVILATEKSGQKEFTFEYGDDFASHIENYKPNFVKALIRYDPDMDCTKLRMLSDYCHNKGYKFLLEMLMETNVPNKRDFLPAIDRLRKKGIEPDVWKLEGMENKNDYESVVAKIREEERQYVGLVILGRGKNKEKVEQWIRIGRDVKGVIGFAIGRTIFLNPLMNYYNKKVDKEETILKISDGYIHFYKLFTSA